MKFSANLGFLWNDRDLTEAIRAAAAAGFDAVECHWPYATPADNVKEALVETGLPMLGLNTLRGRQGENGLAALPNRTEEARAAIDQAISYADAVNAGAIHVMAGFADGAAARAAFAENLRYACGRTDRTILIEPLNAYDAPGYFLKDTDQAAEIISDLALPNLKLMFDCYHVGRTEGHVRKRLSSLFSIIGHIQFASVPTREAPDQGEVDYKDIFAHIAALGWNMPLGAEFRSSTHDHSWMAALRAA